MVQNSSCWVCLMSVHSRQSYPDFGTLKINCLIQEAVRTLDNLPGHVASITSLIMKESAVKEKKKADLSSDFSSQVLLQSSYNFCLLFNILYISLFILQKFNTTYFICSHFLTSRSDPILQSKKIKVERQRASLLGLETLITSCNHELSIIHHSDSVSVHAGRRVIQMIYGLHIHLYHQVFVANSKHKPNHRSWNYKTGPYERWRDKD